MSIHCIGGANVDYIYCVTCLKRANMSLRRKVLGLVTLIQLITVGSLYWIADYRLLDGHKAFERSQLIAVHQNLDKLIRDNVRIVSYYAEDNAAWDATYEYLVSRDPDYLTRNWPAESLFNQDMDIILIYDLSKQLVFGAETGDNHTVIPVSPAMLDIISRQPRLFHDEQDMTANSAIVFLDDCLWIIASHPVLTSETQGPGRGSFIVARKFDHADQVRLSIRFGGPVKINAVNNSDIVPDRRDEVVIFDPIDDQTILSSSPITDLSGKAVATFDVLSGREVLAQGHSMTRSIALTLGLLSLGMIAVVGLLQDRYVLKPLTRLRQQVMNLRKDNVPGRRVELNVEGEILDLAEAINTNLDSFEESEKRLQEEKQISEVANQARAQFMAHMSHELRTPLNGILGMLNMLGDTPIDDQQREYTRLANNAGNDLLTVINDILNFEKLEAGQVELELVPVDLRKTIDDFRDRFMLLAAESGLDFSCKYDDGLPRTILTDPVRLHQVLNNLLSNAFKFTHEGEVALVVESNTARDRFSITVRDSGIGIPLESQGQLFDAFTQVDSSTTRKYGGTGLGLSITRMLVELMEGTIGVVSVPGEGATFIVSLPLVLVEHKTDELAAPAPLEIPALPHLRVLVAEDNLVNQVVVKGHLKKFGIQPKVVSNGAEALDVFTQSGPDSYDLILMDVNMPEMDGRQATTRIREYEQRCAQPPIAIFVLSADALPEHAEASMAVGMQGHLTKPIDIQALSHVLRELESVRLVS